MVKVLRPEDIIQAQKTAIGVYGRNGTGKSTFAASIDPDIPTAVIYASGEPGLKVLIGKPHIWVLPVEGQWKELGECYDLISRPGLSPELLAVLQESVARDPSRKEVVTKRLKDPAVKDKREPFFGAVVVDTWTRLQALAIADVTGQEPPEPGKEAEFISKPVTGPRGSNTRQLWGNVGALVSEWQRYFVRLPMHKVFLYQEMTRDAREDDDSESKTGPALTPQSAATACEILETFGRMYVTLEKNLESPSGGSTKTLDTDAKEVRHLFIGQDDRYFGKGNTVLLGRTIREPTWKRIAIPMITRRKEGEN